jgi:hypothetical protein
MQISLFLLLLNLSTPALAIEEEIPATEENAIRQITAMIREQVKKEAEKNGRAFRDAHRKQHGCVKAVFTVEGNLPRGLQRSLFSSPSTYPALIRYSNGSGLVKDDHDGDGRGMAIKLLGVQGTRNLNESDDENSSQDFLLINHPVFFVRNAEDYVGFQKAVQSGQLLWWLLNPFRFFHEGMIAKAIQGKKMINPLNSTYWSMTASKLEDSQMKFRALPCPGSQFLNPSDSADRLSENLAASLSSAPACFLFQVQLRTKPNLQSVEDPTVEWLESDSPFTTVARISIPPQSPDLGESCEALSFNPWNGLASMRPLGGISRVRREVYQAISRFRHDFNKQRREVPAVEGAIR